MQNNLNIFVLVDINFEDFFHSRQQRLKEESNSIEDDEDETS